MGSTGSSIFTLKKALKDWTVNILNERQAFMNSKSFVPVCSTHQRLFVSVCVCESSLLSNITGDHLQSAHLNLNDMLAPSMHPGRTVSHDDPLKTQAHTVQDRVHLVCVVVKSCQIALHVILITVFIDQSTALHCLITLPLVFMT